MTQGASENPVPLYTLVDTWDQLQQELSKIQGFHVALDLETTALKPSQGTIRLIQLCSSDIQIVIDAWKLPNPWLYTDYWRFDIEWVAFNAQFEYNWLTTHGYPSLQIRDVSHTRRAIMGGDSLSLKLMLLKDLKWEISKAQQRSQWDLPVLTQYQLDYAFADAHATWALWTYWTKKLQTHQLAADARDMFDRLIPVCQHMTKSGFLLDRQEWDKLLGVWTEQARYHEALLRQFISEEQVPNLRSTAQLSSYFLSVIEKDSPLAVIWPRAPRTGNLKFTKEALNTVMDSLAECTDSTILDTLHNLQAYRLYTHYCSLYGTNMLKYVEEDGLIHPQYHIARAVTGRMTCSQPNLQQFPRDKSVAGAYTHFRKAIRSPFGKLIAYDYSSIELRLLALLSKDSQLLHDCLHGDIHSTIAAFMVGRPLDLSNPADDALRTKAKAVSFGAVYGISVRGLALSAKISPMEAQKLLRYWQNRYPKAFYYKYGIKTQARINKGFITMVDGGAIQVTQKPPLTVCANYPVQRAGLSILARALILLYDKLVRTSWEGHTPPRILAAIHDSILVGALEEDVPRAAAAVQHSMREGYLEIFKDAPCDKLVKGGYGDNWSQLTILPD